MHPTGAAGQRKIKAGAVEINGRRVQDLVFASSTGPMIIQVGKKWARVNVP